MHLKQYKFTNYCMKNFDINSFHILGNIHDFNIKNKYDNEIIEGKIFP